MLNINELISLDISLDNNKPVAPAYPEPLTNSDQAWNKYFYDLEQYYYQLRINNYKQPIAVDVKLNIKFKGIG